jgi:hypothetical protein
VPTRCLIESPLLTRLFASIWFQRLIGLQLATITLWNMVPSGFTLTGFGIYMLLFVSAIALGVSRIEVSMLTRYSLLNFESVYLIIWATILFVCSAWQYSFELDTFGAGSTPLEYVLLLLVHHCMAFIRQVLTCTFFFDLGIISFPQILDAKCSAYHVGVCIVYLRSVLRCLPAIAAISQNIRTRNIFFWISSRTNYAFIEISCHDSQFLN